MSSFMLACFQSICLAVICQLAAANVCPIVPEFVVDVCGTVPTTHSGADVFLNIKNLGNGETCHCEFKIDGVDVKGKLRVLYLDNTPMLPVNHCPGMLSNFSSNGQSLLQMNGCRGLTQWVPVASSQNGLDMHVLKQAVASPVKSELCLIIGFRDVDEEVFSDNRRTTITCSTKSSVQYVQGTTASTGPMGGMDMSSMAMGNHMHTFSNQAVKTTISPTINLKP